MASGSLDRSITIKTIQGQNVTWRPREPEHFLLPESPVLDLSPEVRLEIHRMEKEEKSERSTETMRRIKRIFRRRVNREDGEGVDVRPREESEARREEMGVRGIFRSLFSKRKMVKKSGNDTAWNNNHQLSRPDVLEQTTISRTPPLDLDHPAQETEDAIPRIPTSPPMIHDLLEDVMKALMAPSVPDIIAKLSDSKDTRTLRRSSGVRDFITFNKDERDILGLHNIPPPSNPPKSLEKSEEGLKTTKQKMRGLKEDVSASDQQSAKLSTDSLGIYTTALPTVVDVTSLADAMETFLPPLPTYPPPPIPKPITHPIDSTEREISYLDLGAAVTSPLVLHAKAKNQTQATNTSSTISSLNPTPTELSTSTSLPGPSTFSLHAHSDSDTDSESLAPEHYPRLSSSATSSEFGFRPTVELMPGSWPEEDWEVETEIETEVESEGEDSQEMDSEERRSVIARILPGVLDRDMQFAICRVVRERRAEGRCGQGGGFSSGKGVTGRRSSC